MQIRVIVSNKQPEKNQSLEAYQTEVIGSISAIFMDSHNLYQYLNSEENKKSLSSYNPLSSMRQITKSVG